MIVRDLDVLVEASQRADVGVTSRSRRSTRVWRRTEPSSRASAPAAKALKELVDAGVKASVGMAPSAGISDRPEQLRECAAAEGGGANRHLANLLFLRPGTREHFLDTRRGLAEQLPLYERSTRAARLLGSEERNPLRPRWARSCASKASATAKIRLAPPPEPSSCR